LGVLLGGLVAAFPVAILLYWLTNNLWTLAQQHVVFRKLAAEEALRPAVVPEPVESGPVAVESGREPRPGAKPVAPRATTRRPTNAAARTGGKAAAGRRAPARRGGR
jgi:YidC/Oxa1 family membrane protein insertase